MSSTSVSALTRSIGYPLGLFGIVGVGLGLTGVVMLGALGGGASLFSGLFALLVIAFALLTGPIVAAVVGAQPPRDDADTPQYGLVFVGTAVGYLLMMVLVLVILVIGIAVLSAGGGSASGTTGTTGGNGSVNPGQYLLPVLLIAVPTGGVAVATRYWRHRQTATPTDDGSEAAIALPDVPRQYLIIGSVGLLALGAVVAGVMVLTGPTAADQLTVTGEGYSQGQTIFVDATVENIGEQTQTATLSVETSFGGEVSQGFSTSREVTVTGGGRATETVALGEFGDLTATQEQALQSGDFRIDFKIDGQTKDTYTE